MTRGTLSKEQQTTRRRAAALIDSGDTREAEALANHELEVTPEEPFWLYVLGHLARQRSDFDTAANHLQRSLDRDPEQPHTLDEFGMTCRSVASWDARLTHYGPFSRPSGSTPTISRPTFTWPAYFTIWGAPTALGSRYFGRAR